MIGDHNLNIPEQDYRDLELPSYSMLASISKHGVDVVNGVKSGGFVLKFGSLVDAMCFETDTLAARFYSGDSVKNPTTNVKNVIDLVLDGITSSLGEDIEEVSLLGKKKKMKVTDDLNHYKSQIINARNSLAVYKNYSDTKLMETILTGQDYFKDKLQSRGKILIKPEMWTKAYDTAQTLITHPFSSKCFEHDKPGVEIFYQYKFITEVNGYKCKGMLDCIIVDHNTKQIFPIDLKTGESSAEKFKEVILLHKYYIQGALYREALKEIVRTDLDLTGYTVEEFEFLYISKENVYKPVIWVMPESLHQAALKGFNDVFGYEHRGVYDLLKDYYDCKQGRFCSYTQEVYENEGRIMLEGIVDETMENRNKAKQE